MRALRGASMEMGDEAVKMTDVTPRPSVAGTADSATAARLLGPLEVWVAGAALRVGAPQERALLALLLTAPGRVFAVTDIVAGLWGDDPPARADKTVQNYVSRLRRALGADAAGLIVTRAPGYLVAFDADRVDAVRFGRLAADGRRALSEGRAAEAAEVLREATSLWRGEALCEFDLPFAERERVRLAEVRLTVVEDRIAADLALGAGADLVGELEALLAAHPLRERLWEQLITALYRAGRQADALGAYRRVRSQLVDELGIEPGPGLRDLERRVLAQDPTLSAGPAPMAPPPLPAPLAVTDAVLVGRDDELSWLLTGYRQTAGARVVCRIVDGPSGVGKTRLAAAAAAAVHAEGVAVEYACGGEALERWPSWTQRPAVLICDDLDRADPAQLHRLVDLLGAATGPLLAVLVANSAVMSQAQLATLGEAPAERRVLTGLSPAAVMQLVRGYVADADETQVLAVAGGTGGLPAAVHRAAKGYAEDRAAQLIRGAAEELLPSRQGLTARRDQMVHRLLHLQHVRRAGGAPAAIGPGAAVCPYKGLAAFETSDAAYFFGRERLVAQLVARLVGTRLVAVVGASGAGKSSVVRAGLLPALHAGTLPGSDTWAVTVRTPTAGLDDLGNRPGHQLTVIDQFEEVFTVDDTTRTEYLDRLMAVLRRDSGVTAVITLRADYYAQCSARADLAALLADNTVLVAAMTNDELRAAIEGPARAAGLTLEPGLTDRLLADVAGQPGALPLLSTALLALWEQREGTRLTAAGYLRTGGVREAIGAMAERAYGRLGTPQRTVTRRILLRLGDTDEAGQFVRRRVPLAELTPDGDHDARTVLDALAERRLVTITGTSVEIAHEALLREWPRLRGWLEDDEAGRRLRAHLAPAAQEWVRRGRDPAELYRGTRLAAALHWADGHGPELTTTEREYLQASRAAAEADTRHQRQSIKRLRVLAAALTAVLTIAVVAGFYAAAQRRQAEKAALTADVRTLRASAASEQQWDNALLDATQAYRLDPSSESRASLLSTLLRSPQAVGVLRADSRILQMNISIDGSRLVTGGMDGQVIVWDTVTRRRITSFAAIPRQPIWSMALSDDGRLLATATYLALPPGLPGDKAQLWVTDLAAAQPKPRHLPVAGVVAVAYPQPGHVLLTRHQDGHLRRVDAITGTVLGQLDGPGVRGACFSPYLTLSPDRRYATSGCSRSPGQSSGVWDLSSGRRVWTGRGGGIAASTAKTMINGDTDGTVRATTLPDGRVRLATRGHTGQILSVSWSHNGGAFATVANDNTAMIWDPNILQPVETLRGHTGAVVATAFSPDDKRLYTGGLDRSVLIWDLAGDHRLGRPVGVANAANEDTPGHKMNRSGTLMVHVYPGAGVLRVDDLTPSDGPGSYTRPFPAGLKSVYMDIDAAGRNAALMFFNEKTGSITANILDLSTRRFVGSPILIDTNKAAATDNLALSLSPDGRTLTTVDSHQRMRRWDTTTGARDTDFAYHVERPPTWIERSPRGNAVALITALGTAELVNLHTARRIATVTVPGDPEIYLPTFSPDERTFAVGSHAGKIAVADTATGAVHRQWIAADGPMRGLAFTRDGRHLVSSGTDGKVVLWNIATAPEGSATLDIAHGAASIVVLASDQDTIVTLNSSGPTLLWDIGPNSLVARACDIVRRNLSTDEWKELLGDRPYQRTCPAHP